MSYSMRGSCTVKLMLKLLLTSLEGYEQNESIFTLCMQRSFKSKPAVIASLGGFQTIFCSLVDSWVSHFTATLHKRALFDVVELRCKTAFEPVGNCSGLMDIAVKSLAGGLLALLWADHADLCYYQLSTSHAPHMPQPEATPWDLIFV